MKIFKRSFATLLFLLLMLNSFSASIYVKPQNSEKPKHLNETTAQQQRLLMEQFVKLMPKEYGEMRGKKLSFVEKVEFKILQKKLKKKLDDGDSSGFNIGGFALGFLLGLVGVLLAYIFSKDRNFRKWSWIGLGVWVVIVLIIVAAAG